MPQSAMTDEPVALDTNVLVRLLMGDDLAQCRLIAEFLESREAAEHPVFVPLTVVLEIEWVLRSRYGLDRDDIHAGFQFLLSTPVLILEHEHVIEAAMQLAQEHPRADFAHCLHLAQSYEIGATLLTFDRAASRLPRARLLGGV